MLLLTSLPTVYLAADSGLRMEMNTPTPAETRAEPALTRKQCKALERSCASSSAPWNKPSLSEIPDFEEPSYSCPRRKALPAKKPDLKSVQTLSECLQLLHQLSEEVNNISQGKCGSKKAVAERSSMEPDSLESSRSLILHWAKELDLNMKTEPTDGKTRRRDEPGKKEKTELEKHNGKLQQWAVELKNLKEANGVSDEELKKLLYPRGLKESRMAAILPLLEFVAWALLSEDTEEAVSMLWLPTKQKAWRTGTGSPRYIPNSVWQWIRSASVSVRLDASTCPSWLAVSPDRLQLQGAAGRTAAPSNNSGRLAEWPCVLGDTVITTGRHYWEVEVSPSGTWRIGVMSESAREQRSPMSPGRGYWTLWKGSSFWACTEEPTKLQKAALPRLIGVYVDVGEGQVSFYDVDRKVHIYTFSDTFKHSLIPLFGYLNGNTRLKIRPAQMSDKKM
ncbi:nuclear factor 7, brain-like isoform X2 [Sander lucioperca]|uniref:nuclear factor 7, brain-like isoform X2 n=1 Tax=Sander lucioperca TaxID=283035 RepID=UPI001653CBA9|nr:nuclear factor 7, brain-like isoform X2 [Sander lucioperca]